jgi:hypothetical protein
MSRNSDPINYVERSLLCQNHDAGRRWSEVAPVSRNPRLEVLMLLKTARRYTFPQCLKRASLDARPACPEIYNLLCITAVLPSPSTVSPSVQKTESTSVCLRKPCSAARRWKTFVLPKDWKRRFSRSSKAKHRKVLSRDSLSLNMSKAQFHRARREAWMPARPRAI